jgi:branched-chain amino acid aminotransferase
VAAPNNRFAFFNGEIVPIEQAQISVMTNALHTGAGIFEGIRGYWNADEQQLFVFQLEQHMERLKRSARILLFNIPQTAAELSQITVDLLRREGFREDVYIRPLVYKSDLSIAVKLNDMTDALTIYAFGFGQYIQQSKVRAAVSSWRRIEDNIIPSRAKVAGSYVNSALAKSEALLNGYDEAIVLGGDGQVAEASAANLFIVRDGALVTPPITSDVLEGITRRAVADLAQRELGLTIVERPIDRTELYVADEAFFCGTGAEIKPIIEIDRRPVGSGDVGPIGAALVALYADVVRGRVAAYRPWCTPVYQEQ